MERIAIIDHVNHVLYIEDIDDDVLEKEYNGEEEAYIRDNYACTKGDDALWSWDYITDAEYMPLGDDGDFYDLNELIENSI